MSAIPRNKTPTRRLFIYPSLYFSRISRAGNWRPRIERLAARGSFAGHYIARRRAAL